MSGRAHTPSSRLPFLLALGLASGCMGEVFGDRGEGNGEPGGGGETPGGNGGSGSPGPGTGPGPSTGQPGEGPLSIRRVRRLSNREYNNVVRDLLGDTSRPADKFLADSYPNGFDNGSAGLAVQTEQAAAYQQAAEVLAGRAVKENLAGLLGSCQVAGDGEDACKSAFLDRFPERAFRRPLTGAEKERVTAAFDAGKAAGGFAMGVQLAVELLLQSPQFLYREELGPEGASGRVKLTPYEIASQLSFLIVGSMPDSALFEAAEKGRLASAADVRRETVRLLATPAARESVRELFNQWLAVDRAAGLSKDEEAYPQFTPELAAAMKRDFDALLEKELWGSQGSLHTLFVSREAVVDADLAKLYGVPAPAAGQTRSVSLDPALRTGFMTRPAFLAVHAAADGGGPITRGLFVLGNLFCRDIPDPPPNAVQEPAEGAEHIDLTSRPGVIKHSSDPLCRACHQQIDGIGFGFEQFDGIGAHRTRYPDGSAVDTRGELVGTDIDGPFEGVSQLSVKMSSSQEVRDCFARQVYRFAMGQVEPHGSVRAGTYGIAAQSRLTDALITLVGSGSFLERTAE